MKAFTSKTVKDLDGLKELINVEIDPAYNKQIVCTQSFYNAIDTLKDTTGNYLLKDDITAASGKQLFGLPLTVIRDTDFGVAGDMKAFVGDPHAGIFNADRQQLNARWVDNDVYGQVLMIGFRGAVKQADASAGYFVTYSPTVAGA
jgi:HK97 family phage major capsid protein